MPANLKIVGSHCYPVALPVFAGLFVTLTPVHASDEVHFAVWNYPPLMVISEAAPPSGFLVDIVDAVAIELGLKVIYVPGTLSQGIKRLETGRVDILPLFDVGGEHLSRFDLNTETILSDWGMVLSRRGVEIESLFDLDGIRVGYFTDEPHGQKIKSMQKSLSLESEFIALDNYPELFSGFEAVEIDAAVVSLIHFSKITGHYIFNINPMIVNPLELHLAGRKNANNHMLAAFVEVLKKFKSNPNSPIAMAISRWIELPHSHLNLWWVKWLIISQVILLIATTGFIMLLRSQVRHRTAELAEQNRLLIENKRELRAAEFYNRALIESVFDGVYIIQDQHYIYVNPRFCEITGYSQEELTAADFDFNILLTPEGREFMAQRYNARRTGAVLPSRYEIDIVTKSGERRAVDVTVTPIGSPGEVKVLGVMRDITDQRQAIKLLQSERDWAREIFNIAGVMLIVLDKEGTIQDINLRGLQLLGVNADEAIGRNWFELFIPANIRDDLIQAHRKYVSGESDSLNYNENVVLTRFGEQVLIAWHNVRLYNDSGEIIGTLSSGEDISERSEAERRQAAVYQIAQCFDRTEKLEDLFPELHRILSAAMPVRNFYIALYDAQQELLTFPYFVDEKDTPPPPLKKSRGLTGYVLRYGKSILCSKEQQLELAAAGEIELLGKPSAVWLGAPLTIDNRTIGVMAVQHYTDPNALGVRERKIIEFVSSEVARVIARIQTDQSLRESEARFRAVVESASDAFITVNSDGRIEGWNNAAESIFGYTEKEVIGQTLNKILSDESKKLFDDWTEEFTKQIPSTKARRVLELIGRRRSGELVPLELSMAIWESGGRKYTTGIIRDISDRLEAHARIESSQRFLESVFQQMAEALVTIDLTGHITFCNPAAETIFGCDKDKIIGRHFQSLFADDSGAFSMKDLITDTGPVSEATIFKNIKFRRCDGNAFEGQSNIGTLRDRNGQPTGIVLTILDATEKIRLEEQLRQAQKMEAVGRLAGGIAHDFNNLMTVVIGNTELAKMALKPNDPLVADLNEINKAAERASALTQQLLAFSRKQPMRMMTFNLNKTLSDMQTMLQRLIGEDIRLEIIPASGLWSVCADPHQIEQVIINLMVNARDAMPSGGQIIIETANAVLDEEYAESHPGTKAGDYVRLTVTDFGVGMTPEVKARVFEPFFTTKDVGKGTGLGLSTVYGIIKQTGGNIWLYSEPGKGTTFKIHLPRVEGVAEPEKDKLETTSSVSGRETILIVEDEEAVRQMAVKVLSAKGYDVLQASNGTEALALCESRAQPLDLVITDIIMPSMGGVDLIKKLRARWPRIKCIYMSGYTANVIAREGILNPISTFITKPFRPAELLASVRSLLDKR